MNTENCVCCDAVVPEGRQVCPNCEKVRYKTAKEIFEKVYSLTLAKEVGTRCLLREEAAKYGVELPKQPRMGINGFEKK